MNYDTLSPAASLSPPSVSSGDTDPDDQHISSPANSFSYYQAHNSSSSSNTSVSESPDLGFEQFLPDIGLQATMEELGMSIDGWEQWNETNKPLDPAMLFLDLDGLGGAGLPPTPATTQGSVSLSPANPITPPTPSINPNLALPKSKFAAARASHLLSIPSAPTPELPQPQPAPKAETLSAADDIAQRILARTRTTGARQEPQPQVLQQPQMQAHIPSTMPGIVMPSLPPVPRTGTMAATPNMPNDPNSFASMQLDPTETALSNEYLTILQNAQSMPDFFSAAFNTTTPTMPQPTVPPTLSTLSDATKNTNTQAAPPLRTKTSHTTIERRYRTNLNTRITALRHAVPALRVLDKAAFPNEQPDEHGLCDGVRPARKASKASVLGKATEYIRVLKRREKRLEGTVGGLKALVKCFSGEEVVREWEAEWVRVHGGPETDSIGVDAPEAEGDGDDDDSDGDEPKAKRARANTGLNVGNAAPAATGEKRKRGRPRKSPQAETFPAPVAIAPAPASGDNGKYLLGVFLFFSFFKGGARYAPVHHTHVGSVISHASSVITSPSEVKSPWDFAHAAHTIFSIVLLLSLAWRWMRSLTGSKPAKGEGRVEVAKKALSKGRALSTLSRVCAATQLYFAPAKSDGESSVQREAVLALLLAPVCAPLAQRFWAHAGQSLNSNASLIEHSDEDQTGSTNDKHEGEDTPHASGFATPRLAPTPAEDSRVVRSAVLGLAVEDAEAAYISALTGSGTAGDEYAAGDKGSDTFDFIAAAQVVDVMFDLVAGKFVEASGSSLTEASTKISSEDAADAVRTVSRLGSGLKSRRLRAVVKAWENVCGTGDDRTSSFIISDSQESIEGESEKLCGVRALVRALELHRKVYPDVVSTPTLDGSTSTRAGAALALRVALGMPVFDSREELESARDRMVDRLVEA